MPPLAYAWRVLRRAPGFALTAILTLGVGMGAAIAIFSVVDAIGLRPLPYGHPDQLVGVFHDLPGANAQHAGQSLATYAVYQQFAHSLDGIAGYRAGTANLGGDRSGAAPERVHIGQITANTFSLLQVQPRMGRGFTSTEDDPKGPNVVILSENLWRRRFGGDPNILGKFVEITAKQYQVVGVMPATFRFPEANTELWTPLQLDMHASYSQGFNFQAIARLKPGATIARATSEMRLVLPRIVELFPEIVPGVPQTMLLDRAKPMTVLDPLRDDVVGSFGTVLWVVAAGAALLLVVACTNVANLLLVRAEARHREIAVRSALGASRLDLLSHFFAEGLLLAAIGGALGLALAALGTRLFVALGPATIPRLAEVGVDARTILFALAVVGLVTIVFSVLPVLRGQGDMGAVLKEGGRGGMSGRSRQRTRSALVAAQVALAVMALATSGLLVRTFERLRAVRPGFDPSNTITMWMSPSSAAFPKDADIARFYQNVIDRVSSLPGVKAAGISSRVPLEPDGDDFDPAWPEDGPLAGAKLAPLFLYESTSGGFFSAMGVPLVAGHTFERIDGRQQANEVVVNRALVEKLWGDSTGRSAIGKRIRELPTSPWMTIVGVVGDVRDTSLRVAPGGIVYKPETPGSDTLFGGVRRTMALAVRTAGDPMAIRASLEGIVHDIDPTLPLFNVATMDDVIGRSMTELSFTVIVLGTAAAVTLLLGAVGLYGVIAYMVGLRTREIGVRMALGARPMDVGTLVARHGFALTGAGLVAGIVLFLGTARFARSLLFEVTPADPLTLAGSVAVLALVAAAATWMPARRAANIDPAEALRAD